MEFGLDGQRDWGGVGEGGEEQRCNGEMGWVDWPSRVREGHVRSW